MTLEKVLNGYSSVRNTKIADVFQKMNIVEKWGTGLLRIAEICKESGVKPVHYQAESGFFMTTLLRKNSLEKSNDPVNIEIDSVNDPVNLMSEKEHRVLKAIIQQNDITAKGLVDVLGISEKTVKRAISKLKASGLIVRVGSDKKGSWSIKS